MTWHSKKDRDSNKPQETMTQIPVSLKIKLRHGDSEVKRDKILPEVKIKNLFQELDPIPLNLKQVKVLIMEWEPNQSQVWVSQRMSQALVITSS